jgi:hypothetical protein
MSDAEWAVLLAREAAALRFRPPARTTDRPGDDRTPRGSPRGTPATLPSRDNTPR